MNLCCRFLLFTAISALISTMALHSSLWATAKSDCLATSFTELHNNDDGTIHVRTEAELLSYYHTLKDQKRFTGREGKLRYERMTEFFDATLKERFKHAPEIDWKKFSIEERVVILEQLDETPIVPVPEMVKTRPAHIEKILDRLDIQQFKDRYRAFKKISGTDNKRYIAALKKRQSNWLFFEVENAVLKEMNDKIFMDKALIDAICNRYKELLFQKIADNPLLSEHLLPQGRYNDYKSIRLIFDGDSAAVKQALRQTYQETSKEFESIIGQLALQDLYKNGNRMAGAPDSWFLAGIGKTSEEAGVSARTARHFFSPGKLGPPAMDYQHIAEYLQVRRERAEVLRKDIQDSISKESGIISKIPGTNEHVLTPEAIELLRKVDVPDRTLAGYVEVVRTRFKKRFNVDLSRRTILNLQTYFQIVDEFSPGVYQAERTITDIRQAKHGLISIDISGQGSRNLHQNMIAMQKSTGKDISETLKQARTGFDLATQDMDFLKRSIKRAAVETFGSGAEKRLFMSGDDVIYMPKRPMTDAQKMKFTQKLAEAAEPSAYRTTFLPETYSSFRKATAVKIPTGKFSGLVVNNELIEKNLRAKLEGRIPYSKSRRIMLAINPVIENGGITDINLIIIGKVDPQDLKKIRQALKEVLPAEYRIGQITVAPANPPAPASPQTWLNIPKMKNWLRLPLPSDFFLDAMT